jgi:hypothetical protein
MSTNCKNMYFEGYLASKKAIKFGSKEGVNNSLI